MATKHETFAALTLCARLLIVHKPDINIAELLENRLIGLPMMPHEKLLHEVIEEIHQQNKQGLKDQIDITDQIQQEDAAKKADAIKKQKR